MPVSVVFVSIQSSVLIARRTLICEVLGFRSFRLRASGLDNANVASLLSTVTPIQFDEHVRDRTPETSVEKIARDVDVAIGTLYRHFPTRLDLFLAAFKPRLREFLSEAEKALQIEDHGEGLGRLPGEPLPSAGTRLWIQRILSRRFPGNAETESIHDRMCQQIEDVLTRAQDAGSARADIVNLIWFNGRVIDVTSATVPNAWRRQLHIMLVAYRAERAPSSRTGDDGRAAL